MFKVYYRAPADPQMESLLTQRVSGLGGRLDYREAAQAGTNGAICLTFEFNRRDDAETAARGLREQGVHVEGPVDYGELLNDWVKLHPKKGDAAHTKQGTSSEVQALSPEALRPSQVIDDYWLFAKRKNGTYPALTENSGKWLIFIKRSEIDAWWTKIKAATEQGSFGNCVKVSTAKPKPNVINSNQHVICVYTYDWKDEEDVCRIRRALGDLGVVWEIGYKTDQDTGAGLYAVHGNKGICKYHEAAVANKELTQTWGVGRAYAGCLEEIEIRTYNELLAADSSTIVKALRDKKFCVSPAEVDRWKHHALSYATSRPVVFGDILTLDDSFLALDLENDPGGLIWLVGICLREPRGREYFALWADTPAEEKSNLTRLAEIAAANPLMPLVTWNGIGADMPQLRYACQRAGLGQALDMVESRHLDLFQHARKAVRFPIPQLALDQVARYFAIPKVGRIRDGFEALFLFQEYRSSRAADRRVAIKRDLLEYNHDDLEALVGVAERITALRPA